MTDERFDKMMTAYCDPDTEPFVYHEKKHRGFKAASVIAAALVLAVLGALIIPSLTKAKHSFVLTVNAAERGVSDEQVGTNYHTMTVYDKDHNFVEQYQAMDAELLINGDDIEDVSFRSLNGYGRFFVWTNPLPFDYHDDIGWWCDADGDEDPLYTPWHTRYLPDDSDYYTVTDIEHTNSWNTPYLYNISYTAVDDDGYYLQPENASDDRNDIVEITVTFTDGDTLTKRMSVTYPDGVLTVEEIG